ncbi:MAG TPA: molecular chaperone DnaK, partial [Sphingomonadales bacterium]|nr:molecular chaperone DnaK [Sphingomonadales bacterium]
DATKKGIEDAIAALKPALEGNDVEDIKAKSEALVQASMKLGEEIYKAQQAEAGTQEQSGGGNGAGAKKDEGVVDADFEEVDDEKDQKKKKK